MFRIMQSKKAQENENLYERRKYRWITNTIANSLALATASCLILCSTAIGRIGSLQTTSVIPSISKDAVRSNKSHFQVVETENQLKLVDVRIVEPTDTENRFPKLDLIVRNPGKVAVLKKAIFHVEHVWILQSTWEYFKIPVSWNYTVTLPVAKAPYSLSFDIEQEVPGNGTDRFTFTLGNDGTEPLNRYVFMLHLDLIYNEDDRVLSTPRILFLAPPPVDFGGITGGGNDERIYDYIYNWRVVKEIGNFDGVISQPMRNVMEKYNRDVVPDLVKNLNSTNEEPARLYYIKFLGNFGYPSRIALPDLERIAANDQNQKVREAAHNAIEMIKAAPEKLDPLVLVEKQINDGANKGSRPKIRIERQRISSP